MKPLDGRQKAELDALLATNAWTRRSISARVGLLLLVVAPTTLLVALLAALGTPHWRLVTGCTAGLLRRALSPYVVAPAWYLEVGVRAWSASDPDAARRRGPGLL